jgi:hypothetical protein
MHCADCNYYAHPDSFEIKNWPGLSRLNFADAHVEIVLAPLSKVLVG